MAAANSFSQYHNGAWSVDARAPQFPTTHYVTNVQPATFAPYVVDNFHTDPAGCYEGWGKGSAGNIQFPSTVAQQQMIVMVPAEQMQMQVYCLVPLVPLGKPAVNQQGPGRVMMPMTTGVMMPMTSGAVPATMSQPLVGPAQQTAKGSTHEWFNSPLEDFEFNPDPEVPTTTSEVLSNRQVDERARGDLMSIGQSERERILGNMLKLWNTIGRKSAYATFAVKDSMRKTKKHGLCAHSASSRSMEYTSVAARNSRRKDTKASAKFSAKRK